MVLIGIGSALYLGAWLGAGPRDSLMVVGGERTGLRLGIVRAGLELFALAAGFALGGTVGVGTVVFALVRRTGARSSVLGAPALGTRSSGRRGRQSVAGTARSLAAISRQESAAGERLEEARDERVVRALTRRPDVQAAS